MERDIIPYDPYHPHLGYTLAITCVAWVSVALYSHFRLQHHPKWRITLYALAIVLPIYAEAVSYLIYRLRPASDTLVGYILSHFHAYVLQRIPIDTFLSPTLSAVLIGLLIVLTIGSIARFCYGSIQLSRRLVDARPLSRTPYAYLLPQLDLIGTGWGAAVPTILVTDLDAPLAFTTGLLFPSIYVTTTLLALLTTDEQIAVLCHEWAHILRRDNLWNGGIRLLRDLVAFLPGNYLLWQWMIDSQDEACDALAVQITRQPLALARALVKVANAWEAYKEPSIPRVTSPFAMISASPQPRVEQMIRLSDAEAPPAGPARGAYVLALAQLLFAPLPALLGS